MKRQRGRGRRSGGGNNNNPNRHFESNGPDVKIRGSAQQILDKYQQYARDAQSSGDRVSAENYLQHAEHYYRVLAAMQPKDKPRDDQRTQATSEDGAETAETGSDPKAAATENTSETTDGGRQPRQRGRRRKREDEAPAADEASTDIAADDAAPETDAEAPAKPRTRRTRKKVDADEAPVSSDQDDGVLKTLSRGRSSDAEAAEPAVAESDTVTEPAAE